jgi:hypothetical protein
MRFLLRCALHPLTACVHLIIVFVRCASGTSAFASRVNLLELVVLGHGV